MKHHRKSESDVVSYATSSPPRSPKNAMYFVQSPSHDGDKSLSMHATPVYNNSPIDSPSHTSFVAHHSRASSASRFSGNLRLSSGLKGERSNKRVNGKGWPECDVVAEDGSYNDLILDEEDEGPTRICPCQVLLGLLAFFLVFSFFCLVIWGAARPYKPQIIIKSLVINNFYEGEGTDTTGVPTKLVTMNSTLNMDIYNHASMFGIHASSDSIQIIFSVITIATGQLKRYYQPRKSHRAFSLILHGEKVPLYGAGANLSLSNNNGEKVPLTLDFELRSRGYVIGKLVKVSHKTHVSCPLSVTSHSLIPIKFSHDSCTYD